MGTVAGTTRKRRSGHYSRAAYHAGSWYSDSRNELDRQLSSFLAVANDEAPPSDGQPLRGIICPHAGYNYSGPTAAFSYHHLTNELLNEESPITQILILHPSHHIYLDGCAVSGARQLETPLGNLQVDDDLRDEILQLASPRSSFDVMEQGVDEREHSGEMQYPYIAKALVTANKLDVIKVLPIMCGGISSSKEEDYGKLLAPIIGRRNVLCVVSTDFCHWGSRFQYQPTPTSTTSMEIYQHIRQLDQEGMKHIEMEKPGAFADYLKQTRNTICGRHAIGVWLHAVHTNNPSVEVLDIKFVKYAQSSEVRSIRESSVSYASATARQKISN
jgi:AmmeMemoRadiSam system protein B